MQLDLEKIAERINQEKCAVHASKPVVFIHNRNIRVVTCCNTFQTIVEDKIDQLGHDQLDDPTFFKNISANDIQGLY